MPSPHSRLYSDGMTSPLIQPFSLHRMANATIAPAEMVSTPQRLATSFALATAFGSPIRQHVPIRPSVSYSGPAPLVAYSAGSVTSIPRWQPMGQYLQGIGFAFRTSV